jgi:acyl-CoA thioester hydrolase
MCRFSSFIWSSAAGRSFQNVTRIAEHQLSNDSSVACTFRVRYFETDQMQVMHHAHYFVWFEAARAEFCRVHGIDYTAMEQAGLFLPVVEARCRYRAPARYDDEVTVHAAVTERTRRTLKFVYRVSRDGQTIAEGETTQVLIDRQGKPCSFPKEIAEKFGG